MKKEIGKRKVEVHKMEGLYPCVRLEDFMFVVKQLGEENKKLKKYNGELIENHKKDIDVLCEENKTLNEKVRFLEECLDRKEELNKSYRKEIKDHQLYEEKLEHRIIEFEELLHGE